MMQVEARAGWPDAGLVRSAPRSASEPAGSCFRAGRARPHLLVSRRPPPPSEDDAPPRP